MASVLSLVFCCGIGLFLLSCIEFEQVSAQPGATAYNLGQHARPSDAAKRRGLGSRKGGSRRQSARGHCAMGFTNVNKNCYYFSKEQVNSWDRASQRCVQMTSILANILDMEEEFGIETQIRARGMEETIWWIGANNRGNLDRTQFHWYGIGRPLDYSNFCEQQPANPRNDERCVHIYSYQGHICWMQSQCYTRDLLHYICKRHQQ